MQKTQENLDLVWKAMRKGLKALILGYVFVLLNAQPVFRWIAILFID